MWCIPELTPEFIERMMNILEVYERDYNPREPVICFDEKNVQLTAHIRTPLPMKPGMLQRYDSEYKRKGTANIFVFIEPKAGIRHLFVREQRTGNDFAVCMEALVNFYPGADKILIVQDNLNTHTTRSLTKTLDGEKATEITKKLEFHFTPNHGSWLNMAEIEISVMERECLRRRIPDQNTLRKETAAYESGRNDQKARINWKFTREKACEKFRLSARHI
jgi:hypothetical protein